MPGGWQVRTIGRRAAQSNVSTAVTRTAPSTVVFCLLSLPLRIPLRIRLSHYLIGEGTYSDVVVMVSGPAPPSERLHIVEAVQGRPQMRLGCHRSPFASRVREPALP